MKLSFLYDYTVCSLTIGGNKNIHTSFVRHVSLQTRTIQDNIESMTLVAIDFSCTFCNDCIQYSTPTLYVKLDISPLYNQCIMACTHRIPILIILIAFFIIYVCIFFTLNHLSDIHTFLFTTFCTQSKNISAPSVHPEPI